MISGTLVKTIGSCELYRREYFCGRTTPIVEWFVKYTYEGKPCQSYDYKTKREAISDINNFYSKHI